MHLSSEARRASSIARSREEMRPEAPAPRTGRGGGANSAPSCASNASESCPGSMIAVAFSSIEPDASAEPVARAASEVLRTGFELGRFAPDADFLGADFAEAFFTNFFLTLFAPAFDAAFLGAFLAVLGAAFGAALDFDVACALVFGRALAPGVPRPACFFAGAAPRDLVGLEPEFFEAFFDAAFLDGAIRMQA